MPNDCSDASDNLLSGTLPSSIGSVSTGNYL